MPFFHFLKKVSACCANHSKGMMAAGRNYPAAFYFYQ